MPFFKSPICVSWFALSRSSQVESRKWVGLDCHSERLDLLLRGVELSGFGVAEQSVRPHLG